MTFTEWQATRKRTEDESGAPCYEYGPGRNVIHILETGYAVDWMGSYQDFETRTEAEQHLFKCAELDGCL